MSKYILVNSITALSGGLGLTAIFLAQADLLYLSYALALLAFVTDSADGYLARKLKATSRFGAIFDSLADVLVYLVYPAVLGYYVFGLNDLVSLIILILFLLCGIFRLVRFSRQGLISVMDKKYYTGLPVVFSHLVILFLIVIKVFSPGGVKISGCLLLGVMAILMVTKFRFKKPTGGYLKLLIATLLIIAGLMFYYAFR